MNDQANTNEEALEALRQAEQRYRSIFENCLEGIFQTTPDGKYLCANPALARIYGYESADDLIAALTDIGTQLYVEPARRTEFIRLVREEGKVIDFESQVYRRDRGVIWISENARVVRDEVSGEVLYYEGMVQDITRRKAAETERDQANARLSVQYAVALSGGSPAFGGCVKKDCAGDLRKHALGFWGALASGYDSERAALRGYLECSEIFSAGIC